MVDQTQNHDRQNRADGAQRHKAERIAVGVPVAAYGRHADAQRQYERNGHGAGRHAARVKRHGQERIRHEKRQREHDRVGNEQKHPHFDAQENAQKRNHQKYAHADPKGRNQPMQKTGEHIVAAGGRVAAQIQAKAQAA